MEDDGCIVINSGYGIENCTRERMTRILMGHGIPYPDSIIVNTNEAVFGELKNAGINNCWIKRGDFHAMHKEDVSYVAMQRRLRRFFRNISLEESRGRL